MIPSTTFTNSGNPYKMGGNMMYVKCKNTDDALKVFDKMHEQVLVTWTSLIVVNANNGNS